MDEIRKINGKKLKGVELETVTKLQEDLYSPTTIDQFTGNKTREMLDILEIKSPPIAGIIKVSSNPNTWIMPREKITDGNRAAWIKKMKKKYTIR